MRWSLSTTTIDDQDSTWRTFVTAGRPQSDKVSSVVVHRVMMPMAVVQTAPAADGRVVLLCAAVVGALRGRSSHHGQHEHNNNERNPTRRLIII